MNPPRSQLAREKLIHAVIYFAAHTRACHKVKLYKLLYFLDVDVYRQTGRSVTGLSYFAWKMGPVPASLHEEIADPRPDFAKAVMFRKGQRQDPTEADLGWLEIKPRVSFDKSVFTARELGAMAKLADIYQEADAGTMVIAAHVPGDPWHKIYEVQGERHALIPYELALGSGSITREQAEIIAADSYEVGELFK